MSKGQRHDIQANDIQACIFDIQAFTNLVSVNAYEITTVIIIIIIIIIILVRDGEN